MNLYTKSKKGITRLIFVNAVFFLLTNIILSTSGNSSFLTNFALSSNALDVLLKPWTILTSMFLHVDFLHILFNMLYLFLFGQILSSRLGSQSVVTVYVFGGFVGAIFYLLFYNVISGSQVSYLALGASGGVMAIMAAATTLNPNKAIRVFLLGSVKIKWIFLVIFISSSIYNININTGGKIDHMGGALFGFVYITLIRTRNIFIGRWFDRLCLYFSYDFSKKNINKSKKKYSTGFRGSVDRRDSNSIKVAVKNFMEKEDVEEELDKLLARVKKVGLDNLSEKDRERLIELSKKI